MNRDYWKEHLAEKVDEEEKAKEEFEMWQREERRMRNDPFYRQSILRQAKERRARGEAWKNQMEEWQKEREEKIQKARKAIPDSLIVILFDYAKNIRIVLSIITTAVLAIINPITLIATIPFLLFFALDECDGSPLLLGAGCIALIIFAFNSNAWFGLLLIIVSIIGFTLFKKHGWLTLTIIALMFDIGTAIFYDGATFAYVLPATIFSIGCSILWNISSESNPLTKKYLKEAKRSVKDPRVYQDLVRVITKNDKTYYNL